MDPIMNINFNFFGTHNDNNIIVVGATCNNNINVIMGKRGRYR